MDEVTQRAITHLACLLVVTTSNPSGNALILFGIERDIRAGYLPDAHKQCP